MNATFSFALRRFPFSGHVHAAVRCALLLLVCLFLTPLQAAAQGGSAIPSLSLQTLGKPFVVPLELADGALDNHFVASNLFVVPEGMVLIVDWVSATVRADRNEDVPLGESLNFVLQGGPVFELNLGSAPNRAGHRDFYFGGHVQTVLLPGSYRIAGRGMIRLLLSGATFVVTGRLIDAQ